MNEDTVKHKFIIDSCGCRLSLSLDRVRYDGDARLSIRGADNEGRLEFFLTPGEMLDLARALEHQASVLGDWQVMS